MRTFPESHIRRCLVRPYRCIVAGIIHTVSNQLDCVGLCCRPRLVNTAPTSEGTTDMYLLMFVWLIGLQLASGQPLLASRGWETKLERTCFDYQIPNRSYAHVADAVQACARDNECSGVHDTGCYGDRMRDPGLHTLLCSRMSVPWKPDLSRREASLTTVVGPGISSHGCTRIV